MPMPKPNKKEIEKQSDTISVMNNFKYFVKIEKAFEEKGDWYVEGIASGTLEDATSGKMTRNALERFVEALPLPLTDNHKKGEILAQVGEVVEATLLDDNSLFIRAKLDKENPSVGYLVKKVSEGKKFAFSIDGWIKNAKKIFSEKSGKFITEYLDVLPEAISITTRPAYETSFLSVLQKSMDKSEENKIIKEQKMEEEKIEQVIPEENETAKADEVKESPEATEAIEEEKSDEIVEEKNDNVQSDSSKATLKEESKKEEEVTTSQTTEDESKESNENTIEQLSKKLDSLTELVNSMTGFKPEIKEVEVQKQLSPMEEALQIIKEQNRLMKSLQNKVDNLEKLPFQKKTRAMLPILEKSIEENHSPKSIKEMVENIV
jgi:chemotaxis protein histidine kinase CheA